MAKMQTPLINLVHTIICDDIRREDNGKFILIGVYPEIILLNAIPAQIILSIWMQFRVQVFSKVTLEFEIRGTALDENKPFSLEIGDEKMFGQTQSIPLFVKLPFNIKAEGAFTIFYRKRGEEEWQIANSISIARSSVPAQLMQ